MRMQGDLPSDAAPKSLAFKARRQNRVLAIQRMSYVGRALVFLHGLERDVRRDWRDSAELDVQERAATRASLWKVIDGIIDRRRILCGDPLPQRNGAREGPRRMLELEPMPIPEPESVPEQPGSGDGSQL